MKANNLITLLFLSVIFVASSCSQARYSHMTVRGKEGQRVANAERTNKSEEAVLVSSETADAKAVSTEVQEEEAIQLPEEISTLGHKAIDRVEAKVEDSQLTKEQLVQVVETLEVHVPEVVRESKIVKDAYEKANKDESSQDMRSLIWLLIVIILILVILNLVLDLLPGFVSGILGLIILILILLWLLGMV